MVIFFAAATGLSVRVGVSFVAFAFNTYLFCTLSAKAIIVMPPKRPVDRETVPPAAVAVNVSEEAKRAAAALVAAVGEVKADYRLDNVSDQKVVQNLAEDAKNAFVAVVRDIEELNGSADVAGVQASYIQISEYVQNFDGLDVSDSLKKALFLAYNWQALGKGPGGLAGSAVRWALKSNFHPGRETRVHTIVPVTAHQVITEYNKAAQVQKELVNFFLTNAVSVATLAGAMVNKIVHHWDAQHTGAQKAFINAMGMSQHISEDQFRPLFYLAVHPLPLKFTEDLRSLAAAGQADAVAEVVRLRCSGPPAGYGALNACAAAIPSLLAEKILNAQAWPNLEVPSPPQDGDDMKAYIKEHTRVSDMNVKMTARREAIPGFRIRLERIVTANRHISANAGRHHQFALKYGFEAREVYDVAQHVPEMVIVTAYILSKVGGTLATSSAIKKFKDQHSREVNQAIEAFGRMDDKGDIFDTLGF